MAHEPPKIDRFVMRPGRFFRDRERDYSYNPGSAAGHEVRMLLWALNTLAGEIKTLREQVQVLRESHRRTGEILGKFGGKDGL